MGAAKVSALSILKTLKQRARPFRTPVPKPFLQVPGTYLQMHLLPEMQVRPPEPGATCCDLLAGEKKRS
jgi:hypothetical protein